MAKAARYWWAWVIAAMWITGMTMIAVMDDDALGLFVGLMAAVATALVFVRHWTLRTGRAFVHGYHAGYHDASRDDVSREPCSVLDLAERVDDRYRRLA